MKEGFLFPHKKQASETDIKLFQSIVGSIMFAMVETWPDIAFATSCISQHAKSPSRAHIEAAKTILRDLSYTHDLGIISGGGDLNVTGYSDSGDKESKRSSGFVFILNWGPISCSKRQPTVALSSTEAEYVALTLAAKEATWLRLLLTELRAMSPPDQFAHINVGKTNMYIREFQS